MRNVMFLMLMIFCGGLAQAVVVNLDVDGGGIATYSGQGAYADPGNNFWNSVTQTSTNLIASDGVTATTIGVAINSNKGIYGTANITNALMADYCAVRSATMTIDITGLEAGQEYELYIYCNGDKVDQNSEVTFGGNTVTTVGLFSDDLVLNENYVIILATADENGEVSGTITNNLSQYAAINGMQIAPAVYPGQAHTPAPTGTEVDSETINWVSWEAPLTKYDVDGDPNLESVDSYDITYYILDNGEVDASDPNWLKNDVVFDDDVTSPYTFAEDLLYEQTVFWRVDTHVTWDSNDFTGTEELTSIVQGKDWQFTTAPKYTAPEVTTFENVITTVELATVGANLSAEITGNSTDLTVSDFELLENDFQYPGSGALTQSTWGANPTAILTATEPGIYKVKLTVTDTAEGDFGPTTIEAIAQIIVYADACEAKKASPGGWDGNEYDFDDNCVVNLLDFAELAAAWLDDTSMKAQETETYDVVSLELDADIIVSAGQDEYAPNDPNYTWDAPLLSNSGGPRNFSNTDCLDGIQLGYTDVNDFLTYEIVIPEDTTEPIAYTYTVTTRTAYPEPGEDDPAMFISFGSVTSEGATDVVNAYGSVTLSAGKGWGGQGNPDQWNIDTDTLDFGAPGTYLVRVTFSDGFNLDFFALKKIEE